MKLLDPPHKAVAFCACVQLYDSIDVSYRKHERTRSEQALQPGITVYFLCRVYPKAAGANGPTVLQFVDGGKKLYKHSIMEARRDENKRLRLDRTEAWMFKSALRFGITHGLA